MLEDSRSHSNSRNDEQEVIRIGVSAEELEAVLQKPGEARGLPNAAYVDNGFYEQEKRRIFGSSWAGLGFAKDISQPGDAKPYNFTGQPLVAIRGRDGQIRVFLNVCRHRGMILVEEPKRIKNVIRCPYHSWCYSFEGELKTTPHVGGPGKNVHDDICREDLGLIEVRSHIWMGVIFVNLDGNAPDFEESAGDLVHRWAEFDRPLHHDHATSFFSLNIATNWKLAIENFSESYHLPWVHPGLNSYSRLEDHYNIVADSYGGQGTLVYRQPVGEDGSSFEDFEGLSDKWDTGAEYIALFPNVMLGVHRDHTFAIIVEPDGPGRCTEHISIYYSDETMLTPKLHDLRTNNSRLWKDVFVEDIFVVEGMQRGRHANAFDGGRFSPVMDEATHAFHSWVARKLS